MKFGGPYRPGWDFLHLADGLATPTKHARPGRSVLDPRHENIQSTGEDLLEIFTDSDWAGNRTRKSVSFCPLLPEWRVTTHFDPQSKVKKARPRHVFGRVRGDVAMTTGASEGVFRKRTALSSSLEGNACAGTPQGDS